VLPGRGLAALAAATAGGALGSQTFLLGLGPEKPPVLKLAQNTGMLDGRAEPVNQTFGGFAFAGSYKCHAILLCRFKV
jgi:hypothetical protein